MFVILSLCVMSVIDKLFKVTHKVGKIQTSYRIKITTYSQKKVYYETEIYFTRITNKQNTKRENNYY